MPLSGSASEQDLSDRIRDGGFAVALSGGGHRATLATLGALMALVDRGLGPKIMQVASVSGGSITNAFVAQRCRLESLKFSGLDGVAQELASIVIRQGVLTNAWIAALLLVPIAVGTGIAIALPAPWLGALIGAGAALALLLGSGHVVEWLLNRRYCRHGDWKRKRAPLSSLSGRDVDHVFCMTDLVLGLPVYASSQNGGMIWRRLTHLKSLASFQTFASGSLSISELVRASAAFPGIPPRRLHVPSDPQVGVDLPAVAFLGDGGLWNNLGSQVLREDKFTGSHAAWENGVLRPYGFAFERTPLFCFNGSAPLLPTKAWMFRIPGIALVKCLLQTTEILNTNTVHPRSEAMMNGFKRRTSGQPTRPDQSDPVDLVADLRTTADVSADYLPGTFRADTIRSTDPIVKAWERSVTDRIRNAREFKPANKSASEWLADLPPEPRGSYPACGLGDMAHWDSLRGSSFWQDLVANEGSGDIAAPTTLGRIEPALARRLIARGYLNTYLVSLFLAPLQKDDVERLSQFRERLDKIVPR